MALRGDLSSRQDVSAASRLVMIVGGVSTIAALYFGRAVLIPLALAIVFAFLLSPVVSLLEKTRCGRAPAVFIVLVLAFAFLGGIGWTVTDQLLEIVVQLPDYKANLHNKIRALHAPTAGPWSRAASTVGDLSRELSAASDNAASGKLSKNSTKDPIAVQVAAPPRSPSEYLRDSMGPLSATAETAGIGIILTLFILMQREDLRNRLLRLAGGDQLHLMTQALDDAARRLNLYLWLQCAVNAGYGVLFGLGIYLIGIPHPLLWGVVACLLRFIPYIGSPIAAALPMLMALAVFPGWRQTGMTFALFLVLELSVSNLIEPWLYGKHTGVSSLAILIAAIFWGLLWGPVGLILSTPLTVCLILMGRYVPQLEFLEILLGDEPVLSPPALFYQRLLALDEEEARQIAEQYLKENPLGQLYDVVMIPALKLAERDRHTNVLDEKRTNFILQSTRAMTEELYESYADKDPAAEGDSAPSSGTTSKLRIVCVPARDEADEIVGTMAMQLLRRTGRDAHSLAINSVETMLDRLSERRPDVVCVSALPPFAAGQARVLCRQVRQRCPDVKIILGLWEYPGGIAKAQERVGPACADMIGTSLAQIVSLIESPNLFAAPVISQSREGDPKASTVVSEV